MASAALDTECLTCYRVFPSLDRTSTTPGIARSMLDIVHRTLDITSASLDIAHTTPGIAARTLEIAPLAPVTASVNPDQASTTPDIASATLERIHRTLDIPCP